MGWFTNDSIDYKKEIKDCEERLRWLLDVLMVLKKNDSLSLMERVGEFYNTTAVKYYNLIKERNSRATKSKRHPQFEDNYEEAIDWEIYIEGGL